MAALEDDYLLRPLGHMSELIASIMQSLGRGRPRDALALVEEAREVLAGPLSVSLALLDVSSVISVLGPAKARAYTRLLRLEAEARAALGQDGSARARRALARTIERHLPASAPGP
jgi:hypothetical protein